MIVYIADGRTHFWQWDLNQKLYITGAQPCQVHFVQEGSNEVLEVETVKEAEGRFSAPVPNILLQEAKPFAVYIYTATEDGPCKTVKKNTFHVYEREKPEGYIYEETEVKTWEGLAARCEETLAAAEHAATEAKEARDEVVAVIGDIDAALDAIIALEDSYIAGGAAE